MGAPHPPAGSRTYVSGRLFLPFFNLPLEWFRYFVLQDPNWDWTSLQPGGFELLFNQPVEEYGAIYGTDNPDLTRFRDHGGKLIIYHGLADQLVRP